MDQPALVPSGLVVDDEQARDVGEHVDERAGVVRVGGQPRLGLDHHADGAERRQVVIRAGGGGRDPVVDSLDGRGEDVRLEVFGVEQVVLEQIARLGRLGERGHRTEGAWPVVQEDEPVLQRRGQVADVPAARDAARPRRAIGGGDHAGGCGRAERGDDRAGGQGRCAFHAIPSIRGAHARRPRACLVGPHAPASGRPAEGGPRRCRRRLMRNLRM